MDEQGRSKKFLSVVDMHGCSVDVVSGTACALCRVQDLDVSAAVLAHSLGVMVRQEDLVAWQGLQDRHLSHAGDCKSAYLHL
jgi:hypothetical protein